MSLNFPRLTDIAAVKLAVCEKLAKLNSESDLSPLSPENLCAVQLAVSVSNTNKTTSYGEIARFLDDKIPLANIVETAVANSNSPIAPASSSSTTASAREFTLMLSENCKHLGFVASLSLSTLENALATPSSRPSSIQVPNMGCYEDHLEYAFPDLAEGDLVLDIDNVLELKGSLPLEFHDLIVGKRVDALDHRGQWLVNFFKKFHSYFLIFFLVISGFPDPLQSCGR